MGRAKITRLCARAQGTQCLRVRSSIVRSLAALRKIMARMDDLERYVGLRVDGGQPNVDRAALHRSIVVQLAAQGYDVPRSDVEASVLSLAGDLFQRYAEQSRLLSGHLPP